MHQHLRHTRAPIPSLPGILAWLFLSRHMRRVARIYKAVIRQIVVLEEGKKREMQGLCLFSLSNPPAPFGDVGWRGSKVAWLAVA